MLQNRSKSYPYINLKHAIDVIDRATKEGNSWTRAHFANFGAKSNAASSKSGAFIRRIAALKEYGLIDISKDQITITELGEKIVKPIDDEERKSAIVESFFKPAQFKGVIDDRTYRPDELFGNTELSQLALGKHGITRDACPKFVKTLTDSAVFAGVFMPQENGKYLLNKAIIPSLADNKSPVLITNSPDREPATEEIINEVEAPKVPIGNEPIVQASVTATRVKLTVDVPISQKALEVINSAYGLLSGDVKGGGTSEKK